MHSALDITNIFKSQSFLRVIAAHVLVLFLVSCGGGDDDSNTSSSSNGNTSTGYISLTSSGTYTLSLPADGNVLINLSKGSLSFYDSGLNSYVPDGLASNFMSIFGGTRTGSFGFQAGDYSLTLNQDANSCCHATIYSPQLTPVSDLQSLPIGSISGSVSHVYKLVLLNDTNIILNGSSIWTLFYFFDTSLNEFALPGSTSNAASGSSTPILMPAGNYIVLLDQRNDSVEATITY